MEAKNGMSIETAHGIAYGLALVLGIIVTWLLDKGE